MPALKINYADTQRWQAVDYIRTFRDNRRDAAAVQAAGGIRAIAPESLAQTLIHLRKRARKLR